MSDPVPRRRAGRLLRGAGRRVGPGRGDRRGGGARVPLDAAGAGPGRATGGSGYTSSSTSVRPASWPWASALATGRPAVVATTSGTAAVELHPAVVEASHAGVPLIAVTADRPPELHGVGAPQTIEQDGLFGSSRPLGGRRPAWPTWPPSGSWRSLAARAAGRGDSADRAGPGPCISTWRFGSRCSATAACGRVAAPGPVRGAPWHGGESPAAVAPPESRGGVCWPPSAGGRGLIVAGAGAGDPAIAGWAARAARAGRCWPIPARAAGSSGDAVDRGRRRPAAGPGGRGLAPGGGAPARGARGRRRCWPSGWPGSDPEVAQVLVDPWGRWADPDRPRRAVVAADPGPWPRRWWPRPAGAAPGPVAGLGVVRASGPSAERSAQAVLDAELGGRGRPGDERAGRGPGRRGRAARRRPRWWCRRRCRSATSSGLGARGSRSTVLANRGANGIDGVCPPRSGWRSAPARRRWRCSATWRSSTTPAPCWARPAGTWPSPSWSWTTTAAGSSPSCPQAAGAAGAQFERSAAPPTAPTLRPRRRPRRGRATGGGPDALDDLVAGSGHAGVRLAVVRSNRAANVAAHDRLHRAIADR